MKDQDNKGKRKQKPEKGEYWFWISVILKVSLKSAARAQLSRVCSEFGDASKSARCFCSGSSG